MILHSSVQSCHLIHIITGFRHKSDYKIHICLVLIPHGKHLLHSTVISGNPVRNLFLLRNIGKLFITLQFPRRNVVVLTDPYIILIAAGQIVLHHITGRLHFLIMEQKFIELPEQRRLKIPHHLTMLLKKLLQLRHL